MRKFLALMAVVLLVSSTGIAFAKVTLDQPERLDATQALRNGDLENDMPARNWAPTMRDTISFGYYETRLDGLKYAILDETWTFDHGAADINEGWTVRDLTENDRAFWRHITQAKWIAEGNPLPAPSISGVGLAMCGSTFGYADTLGWQGGLGYGNNWCQRLTSPTFNYDGTGTVDLSFKYFNESEPDFDYTTVVVDAGPSSVVLNAPGFNGRAGIDSLGTIAAVTYTRGIQNIEFGGGTAPRSFTITIQFKADGGWSDEDGSYESFYGPVGVDDFVIGPNNLDPPTALTYNFETDLQGWTSSKCPGIGSYFGIADVTGSGYIIQDPCACALEGNVMEFHDTNLEHPVGQHEMAYSPIVDRKTDIGNPAFLSYNQIMLDFDQYSEMPQANGVFYRVGWTYYPYENPNIPGLIQWSPRVGINTFYFAGDTPNCVGNRNIGTNWGLPPTAEKLKAIYEVYGSCEAFGVDPCSGVTNFTPLIDNLRVRNVGVPNAPSVLYETGLQGHDGFGQSALGVLSTTDPGNVDCTYNLRAANLPSKLADSLVVKGSAPSLSTKWEAKMWFRLKRTGPGQTSVTKYNTWKTAMMVKGIDFFSGTNPQFTWGYMDSVETSTQALKYKFNSQFRDGPSSGGQNLPKDLCFNWGGDGEQGEGNEILPDAAFTPGTKIEYFITSNYICLPTTYYYLPDTTGKAYSEIEILPSYRMSAGIPKFPCILYVDAFNRGSQYWIENSLNVAVNGLASGSPIPDPTNWDRYDYFDASSNWNASMYRDQGGNAGATIPQLLGYKMIMVSAGTFGQGCMEPRDWQGYRQWMDAVICSGNSALQGFIVDGSQASDIINSEDPAFLNGYLGAFQKCITYNELGCPPGESDNDEQDCVRVDPAPGTPFAAGIPSDVFGNWCPSKVSYAVLGTSGTGVGNKNYVKIGSGTVTQYAQVINDQNNAAGKYRTVIDDFSYHLLAARDLGNLGLGECYVGGVADTAARINATYKEIENALKWTLNISNPQTQIGLCVSNCGDPNSPTSGVGDDAAAAVTRLYQNTPNPFNPRTTISFSLAADGPAKLVIFDVNGRRVRTLVDNGLKAGMHQVIWDGTDDAGRTVTSGIYWSQLQAGEVSTNRKMVVLK